MMPISSRRELIKWLVFSGFSLVLLGYSKFVNSVKNKKKQNSKPSSVEREKDIEQSLNLNDVVFIAKTDPDYKSYNIGFNLRVSKQPKIIALCKNTRGVSKAIKYAIAKDLRIAVKSGGHSFEGFLSINDGLQINLSLMNSITWLSDHRVNLQPACLLRDIYDALLPQKRILPSGSCGTVGIGGLTLEGAMVFSLVNMV